MKTQLLPSSKYQGMDDYVSWVELPGFRFHPTEEELLDFYLKNMVFDKTSHSNVIGFLNIYRYDPSDLPGLAKIGEREWYFFVPRDRKQNNSGRPNRTTEHGFWKATGSDRKVVSLSDPKRILGLRKTLVFYKGRAPRGTKSDWVMNEYRLPDNHSFPKDIVLCKVYRKATSLKVLEQWASQEEATTKSTPQLQWSPHSFLGGPHKGPTQPINAFHVAPSHPKEEDVEMDMETLEFILEESGDNKRNTNISSKAGSTLALPLGQKAPPLLQLPKTTEWALTQAHGQPQDPGLAQAQDPIWAQLCNSPWLENILSQFTPSSCAADYTSLNC